LALATALGGGRRRPAGQHKTMVVAFWAVVRLPQVALARRHASVGLATHWPRPPRLV